VRDAALVCAELSWPLRWIGGGDCGSRQARPIRLSRIFPRQLLVTGPATEGLALLYVISSPRLQLFVSLNLQNHWITGVEPRTVASTARRESVASH